MTGSKPALGRSRTAITAARVGMGYAVRKLPYSHAGGGTSTSQAEEDRPHKATEDRSLMIAETQSQAPNGTAPTLSTR